MKKGLFITFEGVDGGGKSTQLQLAAQQLRRRGLETVVTREPGGTELAERVRALVLDPDLPLGNTAQTLLYLAARSEHAERLLRPSLAAGKIVLCDRFSDSTLVYQGLARGCSPQELEQLRLLNSLASGGLEPDLTLLFDGSPEIFARRRSLRGVTDRYEQEGLALQHRLRQGFLALAQVEPERISIVQAEGSREEAAAQVWAALERLLQGAE